MSPLQITDTILRDAHQSLIATRMRTEDMIPALEQLDEVGYFSLEMWGGATFDVCMRFLNEDPWERLRIIRRHVKKTRLQMLLRGQNILGYRHYADDVVDAFVEAARENGIDVFRIFDALNDIRNLQRAMHAARRVGGIVEGAISYTVSPVHSIAGFVAFGQALKDEGAEIICIKDMAGMITPREGAELVGALKAEVGLPVHLHTHCSSGMAPAVFWAVAQAGCDIVDCALSPFSWGTSQPPTESVVGMFAGTPHDTGLDLKALAGVAEHFDKVRERYMPILDARSERVDTRILHHQTPGGMLSNLLSQLKAQKAEDKFEEVMLETARVRKDLGYPPLVTPTSQIVGTQAVFNVVLGERYKTITKEVQNYLRGLYGRSPAPMDAELQARVLNGAAPTTGRPADDLPPEMARHLETAKRWNGTREEALCYALFPQVAEEFLTARKEGRIPNGTEPPPEALAAKVESVKVTASPEARELSLTLDGVQATVKVEPQAGPTRRVFLDGVPYDVVVEPRARPKARREKAGADALGDGVVSVQMPGTLLDLKVKEGDRVEKGQVVAVLEAMKMQNEIAAPRSGVVKRILGKKGTTIEARQPILEIAEG